jgi:hypothetical protein
MVNRSVMEQTMPAEETGTDVRKMQEYKNQGSGRLK